MLRKFVHLLFVASLLLAAGSAYATQLIWYMGNMDPDLPDSCGPGISWTRYSGSQEGQLVTDLDAWDGKSWYINDTSSTKDVWRSSPAENIESSVGATIVGRIKVLSESAGGGNLGIYEGSGLYTIFHWGGPSGHIKDAARDINRPNPGDPPIFGDINYHIFRATAKGSIEGKTTPYSDAFQYLNGPLNGNDGWKGTTTDNPIVVDAETVKINGGPIHSGTHEAVMNLSCLDPGAEGIVVTAKIKRGVGESTLWGLYVDDTTGLNLARWYGRADTARGRIGGTSNVTDTQTLSLTGWDELKIVIQTDTDTSQFFFNGVSIGVLSHAGAGDIVGRIKFERVDSANDTTGNFVLLDDLQVTGAANPDMRTIAYYMDENPEPVIKVVGANNQSLLLDCFAFGSDSTAGSQRIYFDWVTASNAGAFAPGEEVVVIGKSLVPERQIAHSIEECKRLGDGSGVEINDALVTATTYGFDEFNPTMPMPNGYFIEEMDRFSGIRVSWKDEFSADTKFSPKDKVDISGILITENGERIIRASTSTLESSENSIPAPVCLTNKASGGGVSGLQQALADDATQSPAKMGQGLSNVGILMTITGRVTAIKNDSTRLWDNYVYIDDGSALNDGSGNIGIQCSPASDMWLFGTLPPMDSYVSMTGVMGMKQSSGINVRYFWTSSWLPFSQ